MNPSARRFVAHLRSSRLLVAAPILILIGVVNAHGQMWPGIYIWQNRASAITTALIVVNPLLAACGAWDGLARRSSNMSLLWRLGLARQGRAIAYFFLAAFALVLGIYLLITVVSHIPIGTSGVPSGTIEWTWLLAGLLSATTSTFLGLLAGLALPYFPTVFLVGIATYVLNALIFLLGSAIRPSVGMLSPSTAEIVEPYFGVNSTLFALQSLWFVAVSSCAIAVALILTRNRSRLKFAGVLVTASLVAVTGVALTTSTASPQNSARALKFGCEDLRPTLCVVPAYEPARASIERALRTRFNRSRGTVFGFDRVELRPRGVGGDAGAHSLALHMDDQAPGWADRDTFEMFQIAFDSHTRWGFCYGLPENNDDEKQFGATAVVEAWLADAREYSSIRTGAGQAYANLTEMSSSSRAEFFDKNQEELCAGTLKVKDIR